ncbi:NUDIX hydrolase [Sulfobacillus harzensis]|uniref:CoA pyrophosphatase n=1 Tax=Sulfobacillus harzensis TaxID=2729629 RepID=A0A7Y0Q299_9FIRM|nr:CoA pyrophosphatase [Sulfobacillus harzensis]NMP22130.1 CoA pyrophosphatase [Sulfobacillus harzensis]
MVRRILSRRGVCTIFSYLRHVLSQREPAIDTWGKPAAVMVLIAETPKPALLLIRRPDHLSSHAGQIAFPGGRFESTIDQNLWQAAQRETEEEVGIQVPQDRLLGFLDPVHIQVSGFTLLPAVVGLEERPLVQPASDEVADYAWVALSDLAQVRRERPRIIGNLTYQMAEFPLSFGLLWGATARVVDQLIQTVQGGTPW